MNIFNTLTTGRGVRLIKDSARFGWEVSDQRFTINSVGVIELDAKLSACCMPANSNLIYMLMSAAAALVRTCSCEHQRHYLTLTASLQHCDL